MIVLDEDDFVPAESLRRRARARRASGRPSTGTSPSRDSCGRSRRPTRSCCASGSRPPRGAAARRVIHERHFTRRGGERAARRGSSRCCASCARRATGSPTPRRTSCSPRPRRPTAAASPGARSARPSSRSAGCSRELAGARDRRPRHRPRPDRLPRDPRRARGLPLLGARRGRDRLLARPRVRLRRPPAARLSALGTERKRGARPAPRSAVHMGGVSVESSARHGGGCAPPESAPGAGRLERATPERPCSGRKRAGAPFLALRLWHRRCPRGRPLTAIPWGPYGVMGAVGERQLRASLCAPSTAIGRYPRPAQRTPGQVDVCWTRPISASGRSDRDQLAGRARSRAAARASAGSTQRSSSTSSPGDELASSGRIRHQRTSLLAALAIAVARRRRAPRRARSAGRSPPRPRAARASLPALAGLELALRQRPVVVARPVDDRDLAAPSRRRGPPPRRRRAPPASLIRPRPGAAKPCSRTASSTALAVLVAVGLEHQPDPGLAHVQVDALADVDDVEHVRARVGDRRRRSRASAPGWSETTVEKTSRRPAAVSPRRMHSISRVASTLPPESTAQTSPVAGARPCPRAAPRPSAAPAPSTTSFERSSSSTIASATSSSETVTTSSRYSASSGRVSSPGRLIAIPSQIVLAARPTGCAPRATAVGRAGRLHPDHRAPGAAP